MAEEPTAQHTPLSAARFNPLITEALTTGPKSSKDIYQLALEKQPQNCPTILCSHRKKSTKSMEWQHEIQRQLSRLARNAGGFWRLKTDEVVVPVVRVEVPDSTPRIAEKLQIQPASEPYTGDPFVVTEDGHFMDVEEIKKPEGKRFMIPRNFDEFYAWKPEYVTNWVKKRLNRFAEDDDVRDWTQDLLIHLRYLPQGSKHRIAGANGRTTGCEDVIETFNPIHQYGASERRFRNYINMILANKFNTVQSKRKKNPVCRPGNLSFGVDDPDHYGVDQGVGDEFIHSNSKLLSSHSDRMAKQHDDRLYTNQFKRFVNENDPSVYLAIDALEATATIGEAAKMLGVSDGEFTRYRNRLRQLGECFENGTPVPKQRRPYKKREAKIVPGKSIPTDRPAI